MPTTNASVTPRLIEVLPRTEKDALYAHEIVDALEKIGVFTTKKSLVNLLRLGRLRRVRYLTERQMNIHCSGARREQRFWLTFGGQNGDSG